MSCTYDIIIIGAGHNALVCAGKLIRKYKRILLLEANTNLGGMASNREFVDGFHTPGCAHLLYGLHPKISQLIQTSDESLITNQQPISTIITNAYGEYLTLSSNPLDGIKGGNSLEQAENDQWIEFHEQMMIFSRILFSLADKIPPKLKNMTLDDYKTLFSAGREFNRLNKSQARQFLRIIGMNIYDLVEESFSSDLLKANICFDAILGTRFGPRAPNTVFNWLQRKAIMLKQPQGLTYPLGGLMQICTALSKSAINQGVNIKTNSRVAKILTQNESIAGVELENGEQFKSNTVISSVDIKQTMLSMLGTNHLETEYVRRINAIPMNGSTAKVHIALSKLPKFISGNQSDLGARIIYAGNADTIERASNALKYNEYAQDNVFEIFFPSMHDQQLTPHDKHCMSVLIPYIPYQHKNGWENEKLNLQTQIVHQLSKLFPNIDKLILGIETLTPLDIEQQYNITGGHWHHGEVGLERMLMLRPIIGYAQYKTSVNGLYLCGAGCHPGGDINGLPGLNVANLLLKSKSANVKQ